MTTVECRYRQKLVRGNCISVLCKNSATTIPLPFITATQEPKAPAAPAVPSHGARITDGAIHRQGDCNRCATTVRSLLTLLTDFSISISRVPCPLRSSRTAAASCKKVPDRRHTWHHVRPSAGPLERCGQPAQPAGGTLEGSENVLHFLTPSSRLGAPSAIWVPR